MVGDFSVIYFALLEGMDIPELVILSCRRICAMRIQVKVSIDKQKGTRNPRARMRSSAVRVATSVTDSAPGVDLSMA